MARTEISIERFITEARQKLGEKNVLTGPDTENFDVDFWKQYRGQSACVLKPGSTNDVVEIVRLARKHNVTLVPQGGNTGLVNGGIPDLTGTQAIISLARMNHIRSLDPAGDYIIVEAGVILADLQKAALAADRQFPLSLGAEGSCRIGGNIATNAGGLNVLRYGMTRDLVLGLEIVLADGQILDLLKPLRKDNTGYDLKQLFIGSEGTLGIITAAALRLAAPIRERVTLWLAVEKTEHAIDLFRTLRGEFGDLISSFELISSYGVETACAQLHGIRRPTESTYPWHILIEIAWSFPSGLRDHAERIIGILFEKQNILDGTIAENEAQRAAMWRSAQPARAMAQQPRRSKAGLGLRV